MSTERVISVSRPGEGRVYRVFGAPIAVHSPGDGGFTFADHPVPAGFEVPLHVHREEDEAVFVIDGAITFFGEEGETVAGPGSFVSLPAGIPHGFANRGTTDARMIVFAGPGGGLEGVFRDLDQAARSETLAPDTIAAALDRNGTTLLAA